MLRRILILLLALAVTGCSQQDMMQKIAPAEVQSLARRYIDELRHQQLDDVEAALDPIVPRASIHPTLARMAAVFPPGEPASIILVGAFRNTVNGVSTVRLTYQYEISGRWLLVIIALKEQAAKTTITNFYVTPQPASLEAQNKFTLRGKTAPQYGVLILTVAVPLFILGTLIFCIRTKLKGRKWPWVVFILFGVCRIAVDWTTGKLGFNALYFQVLGASAAAPPYGPWILSASIPLGAIIFLFRVKQLRARDAVP